ncbi:MAG TPA: sugar ABC transporter ATP-binding protein [Vicinamibacterales bacterium]|nr:sugar ABC transporter ATP-binding protein [Vicinamibacterales bacterium]
MLTAAGVSKSFGGVHALSGVDFAVNAGEIHALVGENGAGKSTLIKILSGALVPDTGVVRLGQARLPSGDPPAARRLGVSCVHQEFTLVAGLSVADNIFLGRERGRGWLRRREMNRAVDAHLADLGVTIPAGTLVQDLSVAQQQLVEIARALADDARVLILDEPTASLADPEIDRLFAVLQRLCGQGLGVIYISHRLEEIFRIADRVTVLRDGRVVSTSPRQEVTRAELITRMVGRDLSEEYPARTATPGETVLELEHLSSPPRFADATLSVRAGEIVGLAGLVGAGRTSTGLAVIGALRASGTLRVRGQAVTFSSPSAAIRAGLAYVTEDRKARGLFPLMDTGANITVAFLRAFAHGGWLSAAEERLAAESAARDYDVRASGLDQPAATLSGGNQQKLLLARYLLKPRSVIVLDEPTRGVDVGARAEIYRIVNRLTEHGLGVLMISSDLNEVLGMSDRVVVMRDGRTVGELARGQASAERVMAMATGTA